jgi:hypothetical protein
LALDRTWSNDAAMSQIDPKGIFAVRLPEVLGKTSDLLTY